MLEIIREEARKATEELISKANLQEKDILVVGCSTSEVTGNIIGTESSIEAAQAVFQGISEVADKKGVFIAAQCCEHLNRAIILEREAAKEQRIPVVNVVPMPKAGGSFATAVYQAMEHPVAVEHIRAKAGLDIGGTMIGMHLKEVAVPLRLQVKTIGEASVAAARTRPKLIGGIRAHYPEHI